VSGAELREQFSAGGLALLVHVLFLTVLVFGVSWKTLPEAPVQADLWRTLPARPVRTPTPPVEPAPAEPAPVEPELPKPAPELPKPAPEPSRPAEPPPRPEPRELTVAPDIALKEAERKARVEEEKKRQDELKKQRAEAEEKRRETENRRKLEEEIEREEKERLAQEEKQLKLRREKELKAAEAKRLAQEKARKEMDDLLSAELADDLAAEARGLRQQAAVSARMKLVDEYKARIQAKIKGFVNNPASLRGKPEAVFRVELLPNGEVLKATLVKGSGQTAYDRAVENAILKASPLPLPSDRDAAAAFRDGLEFKFRPD
jgi:colicin import membrane protein